MTEVEVTARPAAARRGHVVASAADTVGTLLLPPAETGAGGACGPRRPRVRLSANKARLWELVDTLEQARHGPAAAAADAAADAEADSDDTSAAETTTTAAAAAAAETTTPKLLEYEHGRASGMTSWLGSPYTEQAGVYTVAAEEVSLADAGLAEAAPRRRDGDAGLLAAAGSSDYLVDALEPWQKTPVDPSGVYIAGARSDPRTRPLPLAWSEGTPLAVRSPPLPFKASSRSWRDQPFGARTTNISVEPRVLPELQSQNAFGLYGGRGVLPAAGWQPIRDDRADDCLELDLGADVFVTNIATKGQCPELESFPQVEDLLRLGFSPSRHHFQYNPQHPQYRGPVWWCLRHGREREEAQAWVARYRLLGRVEGGRTWVDLGIFKGNHDAHTPVIHDLTPFSPKGAPGIALRYLRFVPLSAAQHGFHNHKAMRVGIYGFASLQAKADFDAARHRADAAAAAAASRKDAPAPAAQPTVTYTVVRGPELPEHHIRGFSSYKWCYWDSAPPSRQRQLRREDARRAATE